MTSKTLAELLDEILAPQTCGYCGEIAIGLSMIGDVYYCHADDVPVPSCYERTQWAMSGGFEGLMNL